MDATAVIVGGGAVASGLLATVLNRLGQRDTTRQQEVASTLQKERDEHERLMDYVERIEADNARLRAENEDYRALQSHLKTHAPRQYRPHKGDDDAP